MTSNEKPKLEILSAKKRLPCGCMIDLDANGKEWPTNKGTANWQNRWQCVKCGKYFSQ